MWVAQHALIKVIQSIGRTGLLITILGLASTAQALTLSEVQKLLASDGDINDQFGFSVAISGDTAVIGAFANDDNGLNSGSAYVFVRSGSSWSQQQELTASDAAQGDNFGGSVAISGDTVVIGAAGNDDDGLDSGSAYVFVRSGSSWSQQQKLTASDAAQSDNFGTSLAINADTVVIGADLDDDNGSASGSAYVFVRTGSSWSQQQKLTASDGTKDDVFGGSVAINGDTVVIGADLDDDNGSKSGSAYVFVRSGSSWSQQQKLSASDATAGDEFGGSVTISGDTAVISAHLDDDDGSNSGSAYVFVRTGSSWSQQQKLTANDAAGGDQFGNSVSVSGDSVIIGAVNDDDNGTDAGSAYVFVRSGSSWSQQQKLTASDTAAEDRFGISVAIDGDTVVIGADYDDDNGSFSGSAYIFETVQPLVLVNNRWTMVSLAFDPGTANTVQDIFTGILDASDYLTLWEVFERDEATDSYTMLTLSSVMQQGSGYWVIQNTGTDIDFDPAGSPTPVATSNFNCPAVEGCFEIELEEGANRFNLIGHPFAKSIPWSDIRVEVDGIQVCTPAQAAADNLMKDTFWHYNGSNYDSFNSVIPPGGGSFEVYKGYWVELLSGSIGKTVKLLIPKGPATDSPFCALPAAASTEFSQDDDLPWWLSWITSAQADSTLKRGEWWVRLQAESDEAGGMVDAHNYLGWYRDSEDGKDQRDVQELPAFGRYLTIVFPHADWGDDSGEYASDMRKRKKWRSGEQWEFIVKSDQLGREVTLSWEGYNKHRRFWRMRLIDLESGEEVRTVRRRQLQTYTFTMYDTVHRFKWVYLPRPKS